MLEGGRFLYFPPIFSWLFASLSDIAQGIANASRVIWRCRFSWDGSITFRLVFSALERKEAQGPCLSDA